MLNTYYDQIIVALLKEREGECFILPDGSKLYALGGDGKTVFEFTGPNFLEMTDEQVNQYIVDTLKQFV